MTTDFSACDLILPVFNSLTYGEDCLESLLAARRTVHSHLSIHTACGSELRFYAGINARATQLRRINPAFQPHLWGVVV